MNNDSGSNVNESQHINKEMSTTVTSSLESHAKKGNSRKLLIIGCVIFAIIAICLGCIALLVGVVLPRLGIETFLNLSEQARNNSNSNVDRPNNDDNNSRRNDSNGESPSNSSEDENYSINTTQNGELPENFPSDIPVYSNENITSIQSNDTSIITYTSKVSGEEIFNRYKRELPSEGWEIGNEGSYTGLYSLTANKASRQITLVISDLGELGTSVALEYK